jgi:DNA (cytosine-5)-methyltransferase 1
LEREGYEVQSFLIPAASVGAPHQRYRVWFVAFKNTNNDGRRCFKWEKESSEWGQRYFSSGNYESIQTNNAEIRTIINTNDKGGSTRLGEIQNENGEVSKWDNNAESCDTNSRNATNTNGIGGRENVRFINGESNELNKNGKAEYVSNTESIGQEYALENRELEGRRFRESNQRNFWNSFPSKSPICGGDDGLPKQLDGITFSKWRQESIKAYGNAIVPQVAFEIFKTINTFEEQLKNQ